MTIGTVKSPNPRNRNLMNTLLSILKVTDARRDVILAGGQYHRFPWTHLTPPPPLPVLPITASKGQEILKTSLLKRLAVFVDQNSNSTLHTNIKCYCSCRIHHFFWRGVGGGVVALLEDCGVTNNDRYLKFYQELVHLVKTARTGTFCASHEK